MSKSKNKMFEKLINPVGCKISKLELFQCINGNENIAEMDYFQLRSLDAHLSGFRKYLKFYNEFRLVKTGRGNDSLFYLEKL